MAQVNDFKAQFEKGTAMMSMQIMSFLSDWLKNHIMKTDKGIRPVFQRERRQKITRGASAYADYR